MRVSVILAGGIVVFCALLIVITRDSDLQSTNVSSRPEFVPIDSINNIPVDRNIELDGALGGGETRNALDEEIPAELNSNTQAPDPRNEVRNATLYENFQAQDTEEIWATQTEADLLALVADSGIPANLIEAECRSRTCRLTLLSNTPEIGLIVSMLDQFKPFLESDNSDLKGGVIVTPRDGSTPSTELVIYLHRDWEGMSIALSDTPKA